MMDIKEKIKEAGYTQKDFAENVLGVKRLALYRKLKGEVKFTKLEKEKIKEVLNIDIDSL
jgi:DNA-binding XRE family transcriptional regulator